MRYVGQNKPWRSYAVTCPEVVVRVDCDGEGVVRETHTAFRGLKGLKWAEFLARLRTEYGDSIEVEDL